MDHSLWALPDRTGDGPQRTAVIGDPPKKRRMRESNWLSSRFLSVMEPMDGSGCFPSCVESRSPAGSCEVILMCRQLLRLSPVEFWIFRGVLPESCGVGACLRSPAESQIDAQEAAPGKCWFFLLVVAFFFELSSLFFRGVEAVFLPFYSAEGLQPLGTCTSRRQRSSALCRSFGMNESQFSCLTALPWDLLAC